jgi:alpha-beta hydrolase superfamily lysophospholipase
VAGEDRQDPRLGGVSTQPGTDLTLQARDGLKLHIVHWPVNKPHGVVVLLHGLSEHARRHTMAAEQLNLAGWSVLSPDLRGHGLSDGPRGGLAQDDDLLHDLAAVMDLAERLHPGLRRVVFGHSTGGAIAARFVSALAEPLEEPVWARRVDGLILSSPALEASMGLLQKALLTTMGKLIQDVPLPVVFKPEWLSSDPAVIREFDQDRLAHKKVTPRLASFIVQQGRITMARAHQWACPTLLLYTPGDRLISPQACEAFAARLPKPLITVKAFPSLAHDLLREPGRAQVYRAVREWLPQSFPAAP